MVSLIIGNSHLGQLIGKALSNAGISWLGVQERGSYEAETQLCPFRLPFFSKASVEILEKLAGQVNYIPFESEYPLNILDSDDAGPINSSIETAPAFSFRDDWQRIKANLDMKEIEKNFRVTPRIKQISPTSVLFSDESVIECDKIYWASGLSRLTDILGTKKVDKTTKTECLSVIPGAIEILRGPGTLADPKPKLSSFIFRFKEHRVAALRHVFETAPNEGRIQHWEIFLATLPLFDSESSDELAKLVRAFRRELKLKFPSAGSTKTKERIVHHPISPISPRPGGPTIRTFPSLYYCGCESAQNSFEQPYFQFETGLQNSWAALVSSGVWD